MKTIFLATTAIILSAGIAAAQTDTGTALDPDQAFAKNNDRAVADADTDDRGNKVTARDRRDFADAFLKDSDGVTRASANRQAISPTVANSISGSYQSGVDKPFYPANGNGNVQFQVGNLNQSVNVQDGTYNESATLQVGEENDAIVSQGGMGSEAAIAQTGDENSTTIIQDGDMHAAAAATRGTENDSVILQSGTDNVAANGILGDYNTAMVFQQDDENTAAQLQVGDHNQTFISQGGGNASDLLAIDGTLANVTIPMGLTAAGAMAANVSQNAAASVQIGDYNRTAIVQEGDNNEAVSYQNSM